MSTSATPSVFVSNRPPRSVKTRMGPAVRIGLLQRRVSLSRQPTRRGRRAEISLSGLCMTPALSVAERVSARELLAADSGELDDLVLAYPTTTRKSQDSEYPCVVIPFGTNTSRWWSSAAEM